MASYNHVLRYWLIAALLLLGVVWSLASAQQKGGSSQYPNSDLLTTPQWLKQHAGGDDMRIIDVRSAAEYKGEKGTRDLQGNGLKLGHIPTAVNIDYTHNWRDTESKRLKSYSDLHALYRGLDPQKGVIVYCNSGRRSFHSAYDGRGAVRYGYWLAHTAKSRFTYDMGRRVDQTSPLYDPVTPGPDKQFARIIEFDHGPVQ